MAHLGEIWAKLSRVATEEISCHYCRFDINLLDLTAIFAVVGTFCPRICFQTVRASARSENFHPWDQMSRHVATFAKDPGPVVSCRVATFA